jgi:uncharacterized protein (UPF0332 family)
LQSTCQQAAAVKDKAKANLRAARKLMHERILDPAMSRLYYALFQAGVHVFTQAGRSPEDFKRDSRGRWGHDVICGNASLLRPGRDDRPLFREARSLRERADYEVLRVHRHQIEVLLPEVEELVAEVRR